MSESGLRPNWRFNPSLRTEKPVRPPSIPLELLDEDRLQTLADGFRGRFPGSLAVLRLQWARRPSTSRKGLYRADLVRYLPGRRLVELHASLALPEAPGDVLAACVFLGLLMAYSGREDPFKHEPTAAWIESNMEICPASEFLAMFISKFWVWLDAIGRKSAVPVRVKTSPVRSSE